MAYNIYFYFKKMGNDLCPHDKNKADEDEAPHRPKGYTPSEIEADRKYLA